MNSAKSRFKTLIKNVFGSGAARAINLLITLALVPLTINSLTTEEYAYFAIALSVSMFFAYADLGLGLSVVNAVSSRKPGLKEVRAHRAVSVVWFTLLTIAGVGLLTLLIIATIFNTLLTENNLEMQAIFIAIGFVLAGLPTGLVQRILFADQKIIQANLWLTGSKLISLAAVWLLVTFEQANLVKLIIAVLGIPVLIGWISVITVLFGKKYKNIQPNIQRFDKRALKPFLILGISFLLLQMFPYLETGLDVLIIGLFIDMQTVPAYDVYLKMFTYILAFTSITVLPLWPAITNAMANGEHQWVIKIRFVAYLCVTLITIAIATGVVIYSEKLALHWTGLHLQLPSNVIIGLGAFSVLASLGYVQSITLNGLNAIKIQVIFFSVYILLTLIFKIISAKYFDLNTMVWSLNAMYIIRIIIIEAMILKRIQLQKVLKNAK